MPRLMLAASLGAIFAFGVAAPRVNAAPADACSLLTQAQIKSAIGAEVSEGAAGSAKLCQWNASPAPSAKVNFVTLVLQDPNFFAAGKNSPAPAIVTPVSGIGDDAYFVAVRDQVGLVAKKRIERIQGRRVRKDSHRSKTSDGKSSRHPNRFAVVAPASRRRFFELRATTSPQHLHSPSPANLMLIPQGFLSAAGIGASSSASPSW